MNELYFKSLKLDKKRGLRNLLLFSACLIVFSTIYALVLPAITLTADHQVLNCRAEFHSHTDACYATDRVTGERKLICGKADYVVHTHNSDCYDKNGNLVCRLPEIAPHTHTEDCYDESGNLICKMQELHTHTAVCYDKYGNLVCGRLELVEHEHGSGCIDNPDARTLAAEAVEPVTTVKSYIDNNYIVTAEYDSTACIPDEAELLVSRISEFSDAACFRENQQAARQALDDPDAPVRAMLDIGFYIDGHEIEPKSKVSIAVKFLSDSGISASEPVSVVHFAQDQVEVIENAELEKHTDGKVVAQFDAESFSIYAIVGTTIEKNVLASDGQNYHISVTYPADSGIPDDADLAVSEISGVSELFDEYVAKTESALGMEEGTAEYIRLFDIGIVNKYDHSVKYQPAAGTFVDVRIELADNESNELNVVHFADENSDGDPVDAQVDGRVVSFEASGFSVYAIVDGDTTDPDTPSRKYIFMDQNGDPFYFTTYELDAQGNPVMENGDPAVIGSGNVQYVKKGEQLFNPGSPAPPQGDNPQFKGWWTKNGSEWGQQVIGPNAQFVTPNLSSLTESDEQTLYARFDNTYYIIYFDGLNVVATETVPTNHTSLMDANTNTLRVEYVLTGDDVNTKAFLGWAYKDDPDRVITEVDIPSDGDHPGTVELVPVIKEVYWISFDKNDWRFVENNDNEGKFVYNPATQRYDPVSTGDGTHDREGTGAIFIGPRFVLKGDPYSSRYSSIPVSSRPGYRFDGWFPEFEPTGYGVTGTQFNDINYTPTDNVTFHAKWTPIVSEYTVQYWKQNADGVGYTLTDVDLKTWTGITGTMTNVNANSHPKDEFGRDITDVTLANKYDHYVLHSASPADSFTIANEQIAGDGSTIINVYYDCETYTLRFIYARSYPSGGTTTQHNVISQEDALNYGDTIYGLVGGSYVPLTWNGSEWTYESAGIIYTGYRYKTTTDQDGTQYGIFNGSVNRIYYRRNAWRQSNSNNAAVYNGTRYLRVTNGDLDSSYLLGYVNGSMVDLTLIGNTYYSQAPVSAAYSGTLYTQSVIEGRQYQVANSVNEYCLTANNAWSQSWNTIPGGLHYLGSSRWTSVPEEPVINMQTNYKKGTFSTTYAGTTYTYYYFDIMHLKYDQVISDVWPQPTNVMNPVNGNVFVSWGTQPRSPYWLKKNGGNQDLNTSPSSGVGDYTIKGPYSKLDDDILNSANNGNTIVNDTDLLAFVFLGRYNTGPHRYYYHIFADLLEGQTGTRTYNNTQYAETTGSPYTVYSNSGASNQAALSMEGMTLVKGPLNGSNATPSGNDENVYYYYVRDVYTLNIYPNRPDVENPDPINIKFGQDITGYLDYEGHDGTGKNPFDYKKMDLESGEPGTRYTTGDGEEFVFDGWYSNPEGIGYEVDISDTIMRSNLFVYAKWRPVRYRVWIQPNGGVLSSTESTWFNLNYGEAIEAYDDIAETRNYIEDPTGEYIYLYNSNGNPREARYIKEADATAEQLSYALKGTDNQIIHYRYLERAYEFAGWQEVKLEPGVDFGTYEQYYANGSNNVTDEREIKPPAINPGDPLAPYIFGEPVKRDIVLRAMWKRAGTIEIAFDPAMEGTDLVGLVPEQAAAKNNGAFITEYLYDDGGNRSEVLNPNAQQEDWIYPMTDAIYADLSRGKAAMAPEPPEGYIFVGWMTPYGSIVQPNDVFNVVIDLAEEMGHGSSSTPWWRYTLTAVYRSNNVTSLTYYINEPQGSTVTSSTLTDLENTQGNAKVTEDDNTVYCLLENSNIRVSTGDGFAVTGYTQVGWSNDPNYQYGGQNPETSIFYDLGGDYGLSSMNTPGTITEGGKVYTNNKLYAVWELKTIPVPFTKLGENIDGSITALADAEFTLYTDQTCETPISSAYPSITASATSTADTETENVLFAEVPVGTFFFKETSVPTRYSLHTTVHTVTVNDNDGTLSYSFDNNEDELTITNYLKGTLAVAKSVVSDVASEKQKDFTFTASTDPDVNGVYGDLTFTNGAASFTLKDGEEKRIRGMQGRTITITETNASAYTTSAAAATGSYNEGAKSYVITVTEDGDAITFTNTPVTQTVSVWKTDFDFNTLTGASFVLYKAEDFNDSTGLPNNGATPVVAETAVGSDGILSLGSLPVGDYRLVETKAPAGYCPAKSAIEITVHSGEVMAMQEGQVAEVVRNGQTHWVTGQDEAAWQVRVWNNPGVALPNTGGLGTGLFYLLGAMMMLTAGAALIISLKRRKTN
ncbi:MAG: InlB B-repeat-containing protein [Clostridia bacterium]|nr:InlB B-repeat-containing protein [Clostridia bacterium]